MPRKRPSSEEERALFETVLHDATRLKNSPPRPRKTKTDAAPMEPAPVRAASHSKAVLSRQTVGIDGNTANRLRRGLLEPQARLDLHGLTEQAAHRALMTFLRGAKARRLRLVLVVTGKGEDARAREASTDPFDLGLGRGKRGVLRALTPRWLQEPGLADLIVHAREAHRRHGGAGALYVYLGKG